MSGSIATVEQLRQAAVPFFRQATTFSDTARLKFAAHAGVNEKIVYETFTREQWTLMQEEWLLSHFRRVMDEAFRSAVTRDDLSQEKILRIARTSWTTFNRIAGKEWKERLAALPTSREAILAKLKEKVEANTPIAELTVWGLYREAGAGWPIYGPWLSEPLRAARLELAEGQRTRIEEPPAGVNARVFPGGWADLDADEWDLGLKHGLVERGRLRPDVADVAWPLLREELSAGKTALISVFNRYRNFIQACDVLGTEVPDVQNAKPEAVQRAWCAYEGTRPKRIAARSALTQLFTSLFTRAESDRTINRQDMLDIVIWLRTQVKLLPGQSGKDFLTENELDQLIYCCLVDVKTGIEFTQTEPDLLVMSTRSDAPVNASSVVYWATALMTLLMAFTGLRRQSVAELKVNDLIHLREKHSAVIWRHGKKREENLVFTPTLIVRLIDYYVRRTDKVRQTLGTNRVFLTGNTAGDWSVFRAPGSLNKRLHQLVERHRLTRDGVSIALGPNVLRRTYVTHQLYKGRSLWFVRAQLGHSTVGTTKRYAQFDRYEHPAQVRKALDEYGRRVFTLWHSPVDPERLSPPERAIIFRSEGGDRHNGVAERLTSKDAEEGDSQSPCPTCERLLTGQEFIGEWEAERTRREERLRRLEADPRSTHLLAREKSEYERFMANYAHVKKGGEG